MQGSSSFGVRNLTLSQLLLPSAREQLLLHVDVCVERDGRIAPRCATVHVHDGHGV